jgi:hypothetical protein
LLSHLALSVSKPLSDFCCFILYCCLCLTLAMEQLLVVLDSVLHLHVDLTCNGAPLRLSCALAFLLLLLFHGGKLFKGFGIELFLFSSLLLTKELLPEPGMGFSLGPLQVNLLCYVSFVKTLSQLCFFLLTGLLQPKPELSERVRFGHSELLPAFSDSSFVQFALLPEFV